MADMAQHRIQTRGGNLNSTLVHMDTDGTPASPPSTAKPVVVSYGGGAALPSSHDAAAMNVRHIQVIRFGPLAVQVALAARVVFAL